jgi:hypothetical protein
MTNLSDQLDSGHAPAWKPDPGAKLIGELITVDERLGYNDQPYPILTLRCADGDVAVHAFHSVLRNEVGKQNPQIGETVAIKYAGEVAKEDGRGRYHSYRLVVDRSNSPVNLNKYASDEPVTDDYGDHDERLARVDRPVADADPEDIPF